jgi:hypothetical protein
MDGQTITAVAIFAAVFLLLAVAYWAVTPSSRPTSDVEEL